MIRQTRTALGPLGLMFALGCSGSAGEVGAPCDTNEDCNSELICDEHAGRGVCQEAHSHDDNANVSHEHSADAGAAPEEHTHSAYDVSAWAEVPTADLQVTRDPLGGWALHTPLKGFTLAPAHASGDAVKGEGHMHLYVDGNKHTRLYGEWFHLPDLAPGEHTLRIELSSNNHSALTLNGKPVGSKRTVTQPKSSSPHKHPTELNEVSAKSAPEVSLEVHEDAMSGWNLEVALKNFTLSPEHASDEHVDGEGHLHLYIDGDKQGRIYSEWYYLGSLPAGKHLIEVELSTNDHRAYATGAKAIRAQATVTVK